MKTLLKFESYTDPHTIVKDFNTLTNGHVIQTKPEKNCNRCYDSNGSNRYLQNISSKHKRIYLLRTHGTFSKTDHILKHKANINKYKKIEIIP